jgi:N-acetyl sugar amidotransferase
MKELLYCKKCVMDGSAEELVLDENGVCNFCHQAEQSLKEIELEKHNLGKIIKQIKDSGEKYDCLIGLSGGVDSSMTLHHAVRMGLKPLCFSLDNGWNDKRADENIMRLVEKLKVPFYRYNIDLDKFKDLQSAFLKAGVPNIEIPTDHILMAVSYELAEKYGIKWILSGGNVATESIMPPSWGYNARDLTHIKDIYKKIKGKKLTGLPLCGVWKWNYYRWIAGIKIFYPLDYLDYNREKSIKFLEKEYGYQSYGEKHCESLWTWWFQNYYLFTKFGFDKRKAHYSSLINSGQMKRSEAVELLAEQPVYPSLGIEQKVLGYQKSCHENFKMDKWYDRIAKLVKICKKIGNVK